VFARLGPDVQREIAGLHLANEVARLKSVGFDLEVSSEALEFLIREGFHPQLGARPLRQTIERHLQDAVVRGLFTSGSGAGRLILDAKAFATTTMKATTVANDPFLEKPASKKLRLKSSGLKNAHFIHE
jgi:ATP-dependent Clp protease ATP-binding subunit ClpA